MITIIHELEHYSYKISITQNRNLTWVVDNLLRAVELDYVVLFVYDK